MVVNLARDGWGRIVGAALAAFVGSIGVTVLIVTVYGFMLGFQVRGQPDQTRISAFAGRGRGGRSCCWHSRRARRYGSRGVAGTNSPCCARSRSGAGVGAGPAVGIHGVRGAMGRAS